jgi:hypothetical protein
VQCVFGAGLGGMDMHRVYNVSAGWLGVCMEENGCVMCMWRVGGVDACVPRRCVMNMLCVGGGGLLTSGSVWGTRYGWGV